MTGISDMFYGSRYGSPLADVAQSSMRPTFELQFSLLQNQVINRLNKEIEQANDSTEKIDAFLVLEKKRLERMSDSMNQFRVDTSRNHNSLADIRDTMELLTKEVAQLQTDKAAAESAGEPVVLDTTEFDALLTQINSMTTGLINVDGTTTGIMFDDGIRSIKESGLVRFDNGDGTGRSHKATQFSDFASLDEVAAAVAEAMDPRLTRAQERTDVKVDTIVSMQTKIGKQITSTTLEIDAAKTASQAEKADAVAKLKEKYSQMLNALSIGFEGNAAQSEYLAKHLLAPAEVDKGSVMNLFT